MPANLPPHYYEAERRYRQAKDTDDKIAALEEMLAIMPKHKGTDHLKADLRRKIAKLYCKIVDTRSHTLHNISRHVTAKTKPSVVVVEDLHVKGMVKNRKLAKAVSDASMGELRRQIEYKAEWNGIEVLTADRWFPSSKTCSNCGAIKQNLTLSDRTFECDACGHTQDRDLNAALNLAKLAA